VSRAGMPAAASGLEVQETLPSSSSCKSFKPQPEIPNPCRAGFSRCPTLLPSPETYCRRKCQPQSQQELKPIPTPHLEHARTLSSASRPPRPPWPPQPLRCRRAPPVAARGSGRCGGEEVGKGGRGAGGGAEAGKEVCRVVPGAR
jgi:hypothetical protein